jgi:predicted ArsR family transcriptional regulator
VSNHLQSSEFSDIQKSILKALSTHGPLIRGQIVGITDIPRTTVYENIQKLMLKGIIDESPKKIEGIGRPNVVYYIKKKPKPKKKSIKDYPKVPKSDEPLFIFYLTKPEIQTIQQMRGIET